MGLKPPAPLVKGVLSPVERYSEVLFGVLMALTMTGALRVASATEQESRAMFFTTLACNIAWGVVDAVLYVLNSLFERLRRTLIARSLRASPDEGRSGHLLAEALPDGLAEVLTADELNALGQRIARMSDLPERPGVHGQDLLGGLGVFLLIVASTFPVSLPFLLISDVSLAMRISRGLSLVLIFGCGYAVGRYSGLRAVPVGLTMLGIGAVLVAVLTALGG